MSKKILFIIICLLVLIIPTTISLSSNEFGCVSHNIQQRRNHVTVGLCQYRDDTIFYCANGCGMPEDTMTGTVYTEHTPDPSVPIKYKYNARTHEKIRYYICTVCHNQILCGVWEPYNP